ncbi:MAG: HlyD family efflux transporter periplasmic adaptor subunit [Paraglaciecola sp.]|uniref:HlyD family efflux transporter periplasmic adaptor subunit n=1 Tax=Paraglaciecola sp. TaxID=1920173 RepID=UPI0032672C68
MSKHAINPEHSNNSGQSNRADKAIEKLEREHLRQYSMVVITIMIGLVVFISWASIFRIDQVAKAMGEVIASSRVQIIQAVDGGVLASLNVREGDIVKAGDVLAQLDQTRFGASVKEIEARLFALQAKAIRLRAEVTDQSTLEFPEELQAYQEQIVVEKALFQQRRRGLNDEVRVLKSGIALSKEEVALVKELRRSGDVNRSEEIRTERMLYETEAKLITRQNRYLEEASAELTKVEDEISQNIQILTQRNQQLQDSVFVALVPGIVKNIQVTTVGGVLRAGDELMQIIPINDELIIEAKVSPTDIALVRKDLLATIRFDPFDYTIFGGVEGKVMYVSADTLKEKTAEGEEIYYRVHIALTSSPVVTSIGKTLEILPGMTTQVDIRTGDRTLLEYLLKPVRKTLSESLGER